METFPNPTSIALKPRTSRTARARKPDVIPLRHSFENVPVGDLLVFNEETDMQFKGRQTLMEPTKASTNQVRTGETSRRSSEPASDDFFAQFGV